jgi:hypothetical protein
MHSISILIWALKSFRSNRTSRYTFVVNLNTGLSSINLNWWFKLSSLSTFLQRLILFLISSKLKMTLTKIFSIHFTFNFCLSCLSNIMFDKVLFNWSLVINLITTILKLCRSGSLNAFDLILFLFKLLNICGIWILFNT